MKLQFVKLKNFKSYPDQETKLDLNFNGVKLIVGENGCLTGDTEVSFNRCKKGFKKTLEKAYKSWNGITYQGSRGEWNKSKPTYVRSYKDDKDEISLHQIDDIVYSGEKEVSLLTLECGKEIKATDNHEFLTKEGWKRLDELSSNDFIMTDESNRSVELKDKAVDKEIYGIRFHKYAEKECNGKQYFRLPIHRLIYEANINNLEFEDYIDVLRNNKEESDFLQMYNPKEYEIHHIDFNHYNNNIENLELLTIKEHNLKHKNYKKFKCFDYSYSRIVSIEKQGIQKTYDIVCKDPYRNFSANGMIVHNSGKTTFFDAIIWGLYGKSMALADDVINWQTGKDCKVEVGFSIGGTSYSVIRYRNHEEQGNKLLLFKNSKNISSRTKGDTQARIDDTIQISYQAMISSVILSSELYSSFLRSKPSERLRAFESILSLKDVNEYAKKLKKLRDPLLEEIQKIETETVKNKSAFETLTSTIDEYNEKIKQTLLNLKKKKEETQEKVGDIEKRIAEFQSINIDRELDNNKKYDEITENNRIILETVEKEKARLKDVSSLATQYNSLREDLEKLKRINIADEIKKLDEREAIIEKNKKINEAIEKIKSTIINTKETERRISELTDEIHDRRSELKHLKDHNDTCPVCNQTIDKELNEKLVKEKEQSIEDTDKLLEGYEKDKEKADAHNKKAGEAIATLHDKLIVMADDDQVSYDREYLGKIATEINTTENTLRSLSEKIKSHEEYNGEINDRIDSLKTQLIEPGDEPEYHTIFLENLRKKITELELEAEELRNEIIVIDTQAKSSYDKTYVEESKKKISSLKATGTKLGKRLKTKREDDSYYNVLSQCFSNKDVGFKKFFINKMVKIFNERVNFYLPFFFDEDISIKFDKDLNETILRNKKEVNFGSFSSGQKTRFELAISFAMFMMVKTFFSNTVNILVFDEILDRNLDKRGFNSVVDILENLGSSSAIFVVSHQEFYKEKFNHHITVKLNDKGFSYISKEV